MCHHMMLYIVAEIQKQINERNKKSEKSAVLKLGQNKKKQAKKCCNFFLVIIWKKTLILFVVVR